LVGEAKIDQNPKIALYAQESPAMETLSSGSGLLP